MKESLSQSLKCMSIFKVAAVEKQENLSVANPSSKNTTTPPTGQQYTQHRGTQTFKGDMSTMKGNIQMNIRVPGSLRDHRAAKASLKQKLKPHR